MSQSKKKCRGLSIASGKPCRKNAEAGSEFCLFHNRKGVGPANQAKEPKGQIFVIVTAVTSLIFGALGTPFAIDWLRARKPKVDVHFDIALDRTNSLPARFKLYNGSAGMITNVVVTYDFSEGIDHQSGVKVLGGGNTFDESTKIPIVLPERHGSFVISNGNGWNFMELGGGLMLSNMMTFTLAHWYRRDPYTNEFGFQMLRDADNRMVWAPVSRSR